MTTRAFSARTAGRNCTFAIHESQRWAVPVKSRKSSVMPMKNTRARMVRIFFNMGFGGIYDLLIYDFTKRMLSS